MIGINSFTPHPWPAETEPPSRWAVGWPPGRRITFDPWSGGAQQQRGFSQSSFVSAVSAARLHYTRALYRRAPTWAGFAGHGDHDPWANAGLGCSNSLVLGMFFNLSLQACSGCFPSITAQCGRQCPTQPCFNHDNFIAQISTLEPKHARPHSLCPSNLRAYK